MKMDIHIDSELQSEIEKLSEKFINNWLPADPIEHTPDKFQYDVKSFCILAHAAFEEYIEKISVELSSKIKAEWLQKKISRSALCLVMTYDKCEIVIEQDEDKDQTRVFDQIRLNFANAVTEHSKAIFNNHGFSKKYLRTLLTPVGIDVPDDIKLMNSLSDLANARGSFAHSRSNDAIVSKINRPLVPEDAAKIVNDCFELCMQIKKAAQLELGMKPSKKTKVTLRERLIKIKSKNQRLRIKVKL